MAQTRAGALLARARRAGLTVEDYRAREAAGERWCTGHKGWHPVAEFGSDASRDDGLAATCLAFRRDRAVATYEPRPRPEPGRRYVDARDGDAQQARRRVNYLIDAGLLPAPSTRPCTDCGHTGYDRRHEYDHHRGYAPEHHEDVEPVCSSCHHERERRRRGTDPALTLFGVDDPAPPTKPMSPGRRRTVRQAALIARGAHPLSLLGGHVPLHPDAPRPTGPADGDLPGPRCGGCEHRRFMGGHARDYPKCFLPGAGRLTLSETSDVRRWWPACVAYTERVSA